MFVSYIALLISIVVAAFQILVSDKRRTVNTSDWTYINMQNNSVHVTILLQGFLSVISQVGIFPYPLRFFSRVLSSLAGTISTWMVKPITGILGTRTKE